LHIKDGPLRLKGSILALSLFEGVSRADSGGVWAAKCAKWCSTPGGGYGFGCILLILHDLILILGRFCALFIPFYGAWGLAAQRWLDGELNALEDA
jgi:hypothetical protein